MTLKKWSFILLFFFAMLPHVVYTQIIDNRELPPAGLQVRPSFVSTDRAAVNTKDEAVYIVLDNADDIRVQDYKDSDVVEITMIGNVRIRFDNNILKSEKVHVIMKGSDVLDVSAHGNVEFTMNKSKYLAKSLYYQPDMERGVMYDVRSILDPDIEQVTAESVPWYYRAEKVTIQSKERFVLDNVVLTKSDTRFDHFSIKVRRMWYLQDKIALAVGLQYMTGQASFMWLPAFIRLESGGRLYTSFGNEKRIGYYFINNYQLDSKIGQFNFGFDFYEQQGQYFEGSYKAPSVGIIEKFDFDVKMANDIRTVKNGDLFSQWVQPQFHPVGDFQRMTQFAWHYKLNTTLSTNGISFNLNLEDLNDPFFLQKYSYRTRFNDAKSINFSELINPSVNSWFGYQGDVQPDMNSFTRSFSLTAGKFTMSGSWELLRVSRNTSTTDPYTGRVTYDPDANNQFLNSFYKYYVRSLTFPEITYNFGEFKVAEYQSVKDIDAVVKDSRGISKKIALHKMKSYEELLSYQMNTNMVTNFVQQPNGELVENVVTNIEPVKIMSIQTNQMTWFEFVLKSDATFKFLAQRTLGTNDSLMTTDLEYLTNTNWTTVADVNRHEENGGIYATTDFFNRIIQINNGIKVNYTEQWASHAGSYTNNQRVSGLKMDYVVNTIINPTNQWHNDSWKRTMLGYKSDIEYLYPAYYLLRLQKDYVKESSFSWKNIISSEFLQWHRQAVFGLEVQADWIFRHRVPVDDQKSIIENDPTDIYIDNKIFNQATFGIKGKVFWFKLGTEVMIDILETRTNTNSQGSMMPVWSGDSITNRFIGDYPKLVFEFEPDPKYHYLPKVVYRYNLFEKSVLTNIGTDIAPNHVTYRQDKSFNLDFVWDLRLKNFQIPKLYPFIYELSEIGIVLKYYADFVNMRNSFLKLDFMIHFKCTKYLSFKFSSEVMNNKMYLYYNGTFNGEQLLNPGEVPKNFFTDLGDSLKIWDQEALKRSSFKLQSLKCELIHDLQSWDMRLIFNLGRRIDDIKQVSFWEPYLGLAFTMKGSNTADIFPEFQKRFVPAEYQ